MCYVLRWMLDVFSVEVNVGCVCRVCGCRT